MILRWLLCSALISACLQAQGQGVACALLEELDGTVYWKPENSAKGRTLSGTVDSERILFSGDTIRCGRAGHALIWMDGQEIQRSEKDGSLLVQCSDREAATATQSENSAAARKILEHYGRPAGRGRSLSAVVFRPADGSTVEAHDFVIAWERRPTLDARSITIVDSRDRVLWQQEQISAAAGQFESEPAKQALEEYAKQPLGGNLLLTIAFTSGERIGVHFSVLSQEREASLGRALRSLEGSLSGFVLNIARSYVFDGYGMYNRTADEYEQALRLKPSSRDLVLATIAAEQRIGNTERVTSLRKLVPGGDAEPQ